MNYAYSKVLNCTVEQAISKTKEALAKHGFGVLTKIDVKETLKNKLGVEFGEYIILGACNPALAHKALLVEPQIGLMLPCNVIVYAKDGKVVVSAIMPTTAMGMIDNKELQEIASEVGVKLKQVIEEV